MKMCRPLSIKRTPGDVAVLGSPEPLETQLDNSRVFSMVIGMHLDIRGTDVDLRATRLKWNRY